jgi:hypothetical protein
MSIYVGVRWLAAASFLCCGLAAPAETIDLTLHKVMDSNGSGHVAMTYLMPKGWNAKDSVDWNLQRQITPLIYVNTIHSPDGNTHAAYLNTLSFAYAHKGNLGDSGKAAPDKPSDYILDIFKQGHPGIEFETLQSDNNPVPSMFKEAPGMTSRAFDTTVKLRFSKGGVPTIYKCSCHFDSWMLGPTQVGTQSFYSGTWIIKDYTDFSAPEKEVPRAMMLSSVFLSSRKLDPEFYEQYLEVSQFLMKQMQDANQERLNANFARMRNEYHQMSSDHMAQFNEQMAAKDKNTRNFCDYVLNQERYSDGSHEFIVPSGYNRAATDGSGNYVITNSPTYQPSGDWHELKKIN